MTPPCILPSNKVGASMVILRRMHTHTATCHCHTHFPAHTHRLLPVGRSPLSPYAGQTHSVCHGPPGPVQRSLRASWGGGSSDPHHRVGLFSTLPLSSLEKQLLASLFHLEIPSLHSSTVYSIKVTSSEYSGYGCFARFSISVIRKFWA